MSTKTIALDHRVYERLARLKGESQSFSKLIDSLVARVMTAHTVADVLPQLDSMPPLSETDAETLAGLVRSNRETEAWTDRDLS